MAIRIEGGKPLIFGNFLGTLQYMAPEMLLSKSTACEAPLDMWSCGILLYIMLTGKAPYDGETPEDMLTQIHDRNIFEELECQAVSSQYVATHFDSLLFLRVNVTTTDPINCKYI